MADRLAATGVLLVGGASERFGSPKALALFRGETLGERALRTLSEACDEVVAVGKADDALGLPFPVLDDGSLERAPVFGVLAGLGAATHETCLVLPVDTPLVTPELLSELLRAGAVPQTGPLPGVYAKTMLPALESRVATGELSLQGVNATVLGVEERLLVVPGRGIFRDIKGVNRAAEDYERRHFGAAQFQFLMFADLPVLMPQIKGGTLRPIGVGSKRRTAVLPDVPTLDEQGIKDVYADNWYALFAPAKTPPAVIAKLNAAVNAALNDGELNKKLVEAGADPAPGTPAQLAEFLKSELERWGKVIKDKNIKPAS